MFSNMRCQKSHSRLFWHYIISFTKFQMPVVIMQRTIPQTVGSKNAIMLHFQLPVSFLIVIKVVLQGKCNSVNSMTFIAVSKVQPFCTKIFPIS